MDGREIRYAVRERDGLRCWFKKQDKRGVFLDSSADKARVYETKRGAESAAALLNRKGFNYKDGTPYHFDVEEVCR